MLVCTVVALAHPVGHGSGANPSGPAVLGQRLDVRVEEGGVAIAYVAEIPMRRLLQEGPADTAPQTLLPTLAGGLSVSWEGAPLRVEWAPATATPGLTGFYDLSLRGRADLPGTTGTLRLRNGNFPDEPGFYATSVSIPGDLVVTGSSLARVADGRVRDNRHGAWLKDESAREPWCTLRPARPWERGETAMLPDRLAGLDVLGPPWAAIGAALGAALGGVFLVRWVRRRAA